MTIAPAGVLGLLIHLLPLLLVFVGIVWWLCTHAPEGHQTEQGFFYGPEVNSVDWAELEDLDFDFPPPTLTWKDAA